MNQTIKGAGLFLFALLVVAILILFSIGPVCKYKEIPPKPGTTAGMEEPYDCKMGLVPRI